MRILSTAIIVWGLVLLSGGGVPHAQGLNARDLESLRLAHIDPPIEAPDFHLQTLNEQRVSLSDLRGKGVLIYFWATW